MMAETLPLFETARETQRISHRAGRPAAAGQRARVLNYLRGRGPAGASDEQIQAALGLRTSSETARRRELVLAGEVVDSGRTQIGSGGRLVTIWVALAAGDGSE